MKIKMVIVTLVLFAAFASPASATTVPMTWKSEYLARYVIYNAGTFELLATLLNVDDVLPAELEVKYGLPNSPNVPNVPVDVFVNNVQVGNFTADNEYFGSGPKHLFYDVTGLIHEGTNTILFSGNSANNGDYIVGKAVLNYSTPEPMTALLLGLGALGLVRKRQRRKAPVS